MCETSRLITENNKMPPIIFKSVKGKSEHGTCFFQEDRKRGKKKGWQTGNTE